METHARLINCWYSEVFVKFKIEFVLSKTQCLDHWACGRLRVTFLWLSLFDFSLALIISSSPHQLDAWECSPHFLFVALIYDYVLGFWYVRVALWTFPTCSPRYLALIIWGKWNCLVLDIKNSMQLIYRRKILALYFIII